MCAEWSCIVDCAQKLVVMVLTLLNIVKVRAERERAGLDQRASG